MTHVICDTRMKIGEKKQKVKEYFRATEVGMMVEIFQHDMKRLGESLDGKIESLGKRFDEFRSDTEENFEIVKEYLFNIGDRLDKIENDLKEIKADLKKIDENKVDKKEFELLKEKVQELEKELKKAVEWQKSHQKSNFA